VTITTSVLHRLPGRRILYGSLVAAAAATVAACGSSSSSSPGTSSGSSAGAAAGTPSSSAITISAKNVPGLGTVLVNGQGRTLYLLTSEKGGKITCTDDNGCTKLWPDTELPKGMTAATAGSGIQASLLGTVKDASGSLYVTYNKWPLYTYAGDSGPGQAHGQGITSFGGTWYALSTAGTPVTSSHSGSSSSAGGGGGSGY
jgi:predicted lipoprotein with Yx(FWY)xxD motif